MSLSKGAADIPGFESKTERVGKTAIHYWLGGDMHGKPVLLWHGFLRHGVCGGT